jgi:type VI secretion system protein ImpL
MDGRLMLEQLKQWFNELLVQLGQWFNELLVQLEKLSNQLQLALTERLLPVIEQLKPIWQDPLWQALALILLIVVVLFMGGWLFRIANQLVLYLLHGLSSLGRTLFRWLKAPFVWLAKWLGKSRPKRVKKPRWQWVNLAQMRRAVNAMQYLTTRRDWRYSTPWFLLIGESNSGKSTLIKGVNEGRRVQLFPKEKHLRDPSSGWHFFDYAVVIDQDNKKTARADESRADESRADESSADGDSEDAQPTMALDSNERASQFSYLVELLHWYRPERAVDGILLTVSAKSLLQSQQQPAALLALGNSLFEQLWQSQKHTGFVLPVYLIVTQCDNVEGFAAYWQAQGNERHDEIIGWSNPYRLDSAFTREWVNEAFDQVLKDLQDAQLQVAASGQDINDIDRFMLFRQNFSALHQPLLEVVNSAFARSSFQEALPLRGIYFTGQLDEKVAFVNDLMMQKVFAEKHLAFPLEKRRFSTQKTLRRFQFGSLTAAVVLVALMAIDSVRLENYSSFTTETLRHLLRVDQDCSAEGLDTGRLLSGLTEISDRPLLLSFPMSWFDIQAHKEQRLVADELLQKVLFPSLECRLKIRAEALRAQLLGDDSNLDYRQVINDITEFGHSLEDFQINRERFLLLASAKQELRGIGKKLNRLLKYLYDRPMPAGVETHAELITGAIDVVAYNVDWDEKGRSLVGREALLGHLDKLSLELYQALLAHAQKLPLRELREVSNNIIKVPVDQELPASPLLKDIQLFQDWLDETRNDWLAATAATSPCGNIYQVMVDLRQSLLRVGFDEDQLNTIVERFSQSQCDHQVRQKLAELHVPPFGNMLVRNDRGRLIIAPVLERLTAQIEALETLGFVKNSYPPIADSAEPIIAWREVPLQELLNTLLSFQQFKAIHSQVQKPFFTNALDSRLAQVSERLLSQAAVRPSQLPPKAYLIDDPIAFNESALSESVASFKVVSDELLQISGLLQQLGDNGNTIRLKHHSQTFVLQQLQRIEQLVADSRLYQPVATPRWDNRDFARTLFNLDTDKQIASYLTSQRQRVSFMAFGYAEPLIRHLQNSGSGLSDKVAQRWLSTLSDLGHYQRSEPDNKVSALEHFVSETLVGLNNDNCYDRTKQVEFKNRVANEGWFATRQWQLQRQVNVHCQDAGDNKVVNRYLAIRDRFNRQLAGKFPFAAVDQAGVSDINSKKLRRFWLYYRRASKTLLSDMAKVSDYQPGSIPASWRDFISQMNSVSEFFERSWVAKEQSWQVPLNLEFAAMSQSANGVNQIIQWTLDSGPRQVRFPSGDNNIMWQVTEPLRLSLRWASGSAFVPLQRIGTEPDAPLQVDSQQLTATYSSRGQWGLFEWLARYGGDNSNGLTAARLDERLLAFHVPVILKNSTIKPQVQSYVSRSNLLLWVEVLNDEGDKVRLSLPGQLPSFAPGFND